MQGYRKRISNEKGFTLLELMLVSAIFLIISGAIFATLAIGRTAWYSGSVRIDVQQEVRKGMDWMAKELRQSGSGAIVGVPANGNFYNAITFQVPEDVDGDGDTLNADGSVEWGNQTTYSLGGLSGRQLLRTEGGQVKVVANNAVNLQFRRQPGSPNMVEMTLQSQKSTILGHLIVTTLGTQIKMRN